MVMCTSFVCLLLFVFLLGGVGEGVGEKRGET